MNKHFRKGDCSPKLTPKASHPWRKALSIWAHKAGRYAVDEKRINTRRGLQLAAARATRREAAWMPR